MPIFSHLPDLCQWFYSLYGPSSREITPQELHRMEEKVALSLKVSCLPLVSPWSSPHWLMLLMASVHVVKAAEVLLVASSTASWMESPRTWRQTFSCTFSTLRALTTRGTWQSPLFPLSTCTQSRWEWWMRIKRSTTAGRLDPLKVRQWSASSFCSQLCLAAKYMSLSCQNNTGSKASMLQQESIYSFKLSWSSTVSSKVFTEIPRNHSECTSQWSLCKSFSLLGARQTASGSLVSMDSTIWCSRCFSTSNTFCWQLRTWQAQTRLPAASQVSTISGLHCLSRCTTWCRLFLLWELSCPTLKDSMSKPSPWESYSMEALS